MFRPVELAEENLSRRSQRHPLDHPDTLESAYNLGAALRFEDGDRARAILKDTLNRQKSLSGSEHPDTVNTQELIERL